MKNALEPSKTSCAETIAETVGVTKTTSPWLSLFVLGVMAGAYIGFEGLFSASVTFDMDSAMGIGLKKLVTGAAFSIGLMLVVIAGAELFTGNTLMVSSVMTGRVTWQKVVAKWSLVYVANFIGSIVLALLFYFSGPWKTRDGALGAAAVKTAYAKVNLDLGEPGPRRGRRHHHYLGGVLPEKFDPGDHRWRRICGARLLGGLPAAFAVIA